MQKNQITQRAENNDLQIAVPSLTLETVDAERARLEAHLLVDADAWHRCSGAGNGGLSGFDDTKRRFICPAYGQN